MEIKDMKLVEVRERIAELQDLDVNEATLDEIEQSTEELRALKDRESEILEAAEKRRAEAERVTNLPDDQVKIIHSFKDEEKRMEEKPVETREQIEVRQFADYIRGRVSDMETRDGEKTFDFGSSQGAIVPVSIAQRIITEVVESSPILAKATRYNVKGKLQVPVYGDNDDQNIAVGYQTEFQEIQDDAGKFTSVDLTGHLAGALSLVSRSLINNSDIDLVSFVVKEMGRRIALFLEGELLKGTSSKATGALSSTNLMAAGSTTAISADNLIELQAKIPTVYQKDAVWIMNPATFTAIKKLKDGAGDYMLQKVFAEGFPYRILGKPVYLSDNAPAIASDALAVLYGDLSGLSVNFREDISVEILREKYATQHALGVISWFEFDSKVTENKKLAVLKMAASLA